MLALCGGWGLSLRTNVTRGKALENYSVCLFKVQLEHVTFTRFTTSMPFSPMSDSTRVSTRSSNANKHPGAAQTAGKQKRRTKEEILHDEALKRAAQQQKDLQRQKTLTDIAAIEDSLASADALKAEARKRTLMRTESIAEIQLPDDDGNFQPADTDEPTDTEEPPKKKSKTKAPAKVPAAKVPTAKATANGTAGKTSVRESINSFRKETAAAANVRHSSLS